MVSGFLDAPPHLPEVPPLLSGTLSSFRGPSAFCQNLLSGKSLINPFTQRAASCALSPGNINNLTGNKGKEQNVRMTARTRSAPEISFLYTECLGSHLLSCWPHPSMSVSGTVSSLYPSPSPGHPTIPPCHRHPKSRRSAGASPLWLRP